MRRGKFLSCADGKGLAACAESFSRGLVCAPVLPVGILYRCRGARRSGDGFGPESGTCVVTVWLCHGSSPEGIGSLSVIMLVSAPNGQQPTSHLKFHKILMLSNHQECLTVSMPQMASACRILN